MSKKVPLGIYVLIAINVMISILFFVLASSSAILSSGSGYIPLIGDILSSFFGLCSVVFIIIGGFYLCLSYGLYCFDNWARIAMMVLTVFSTIFSFFIPGVGCFTFILMLVYAIAVIWYLKIPAIKKRFLGTGHICELCETNDSTTVCAICKKDICNGCCYECTTCYRVLCKKCHSRHSCEPVCEQCHKGYPKKECEKCRKDLCDKCANECIDCGDILCRRCYARHTCKPKKKESPKEETRVFTPIDAKDTSSGSSIADKLKELKALKDDGLITEDDYNNKKNELLKNY